MKDEIPSFGVHNPNGITSANTYQSGGQDDICEWTVERGRRIGVLYNTNCGNSFLDYECPPKGFRYCPYCGKRIIIEETK